MESWQWPKLQFEPGEAMAAQPCAACAGEPKPASETENQVPTAQIGLSALLRAHMVISPYGCANHVNRFVISSAFMVISF